MKKWGLFLIFLIVPFFFFGCEKQNIKKLNTPTELNVSAGGIVTFKRVEDDEFYSIFINDNEFVVNKNHPAVVLYNFDGADYFEYDASNLLSFAVGRSYNFSVQAHAKNKKSSDVSGTVTYVHNLVLETPKNVEIKNNVLSWEQCPFANSYKVKVNYNATETIFSVSQNQFDINQVLFGVGEYNFSVCAVPNKANYEDSKFSQAVEFSVKQLSTPNVSQIYENEGQAFVKVAVDVNANSITINLNNLKIEQALSSNGWLHKVDDIENFWEINLTELCRANGTNQNLILFNVAANNNSFGSRYFYTSSAVSSTVEYEKTNKLFAPNLQITSEADKVVLSWTDEDKEKITAYEIYVATSSEMKTYTLLPEINSIKLENNFIAAAVKKLGKGDWQSSNLSAFKSLNSLQLDNLNLAQNGETLTLNELTDFANYYIVEIGNDVLKLNQNSINILNYLGKVKSVSVTAISDDHAPKTESLTLQPIKLNAPSNLKMSNLKPFCLTFDAVENALGYYVYVLNKTENNLTRTKLNEVFTSNVIDLSNYLLAENEYEICVQAIAKENGFENSELSNSINAANI